VIVVIEMGDRVRDEQDGIKVGFFFPFSHSPCLASHLELINPKVSEIF